MIYCEIHYSIVRAEKQVCENLSGDFFLFQEISDGPLWCFMEYDGCADVDKNRGNNGGTVLRRVKYNGKTKRMKNSQNIKILLTKYAFCDIFYLYNFIVK